MDYKTYLSLTSQEKAKLSAPFLTLRWWDSDDVATLSGHSWFSELRSALNRGGKITFNLGVFKYEQAGTQPVTTGQETIKTLRALFSETEPVPVSKIHDMARDAINAPIFEPSLVVVDGELWIALRPERLAQLAIGRLAERFGLQCDTDHPHEASVSEEVAIQCGNPLLGLLNEIEPELRRFQELWQRDARNLMSPRFGRQDMVRAHMLGVQPNQVDFNLAFPKSAIDSFVVPSGFGARVLGWLEHGASGEFFIRAIALATVDVFDKNSSEVEGNRGRS